MQEALTGDAAPAKTTVKHLLSAPTSSGARTLLEYQELGGTTYYDSACVVAKGEAEHCR